MPGLALVASAGLADGEWHTISVSFSTSGTVLLVDNGRVNVSSSTTAKFILTNITMALAYQDASSGMLDACTSLVQEMFLHAWITVPRFV